MKFLTENEYVTSRTRQGMSLAEAQRRYRAYMQSVIRAQAKDTARLVGNAPLTRDQFMTKLRNSCPLAFSNPRNAEANELAWRQYERSHLIIDHRRNDDSADDAAIERELQRRRAEAAEDAAYDREIAARTDLYELDSSGRKVYPNRVAAKATASASATSASARPSVAVFDPANY